MRECTKEVAAGGECHELVVRHQTAWQRGLGDVRPHVHAKAISADGRVCALGSANLDITAGRVYSQRLMLALLEAGWTRKRAYETVQQAAARAEAEGLHLADAAAADRRITDVVSADRIAEIFDPRFYGRYTDDILKDIGILPGARLVHKNRRRRAGA
jgi:phosphatidylserine/phosphatidylglycerophosphate/cardiolipin synthase-like enzyme